MPTDDIGRVSLGFHTIHFSPMFGGDAPILEVIRITGAAGFDAIGVDLASIDAHLAGGGTVAEVASAIEAAGLQCSDVLVLAPGQGGDLLSTARRLGSLAETLGAASCIAAVPEPTPWGELVASLTACADVLAGHDCRLAIEFTPYSALPTLTEAKELCRAIGWHHCGLVLDSLHFFRSGSPWDELASLNPEHLAVVQWNDASSDPLPSLAEESRHHRLPPGQGELPLVQLAAAICDLGWGGTVSAEVLSARVRHADPASAIPAAYAAMAGEAAGWATSSAG